MVLWISLLLLLVVEEEEKKKLDAELRCRDREDSRRGISSSDGAGGCKVAESPVSRTDPSPNTASRVHARVSRSCVHQKLTSEGAKVNWGKYSSSSA